MKLLGLSVLSASLLFVSCAQDGFDEETFASSVTNTQMLSPNMDEVNIVSSPDGAMTIVSWPVIHGAAGYKVRVEDVTMSENPVVLVNDSIIDGCSFSVKREEDKNYRLSILTLGNAKYNNKDAETASVKAFNSFAESFATIPAGTDIAEWFANNPIPADKVGEMLYYDLEPNGEYTLNAPVNFSNHLVTLRTTSKVDFAKITIEGDAGFITARGMGLKYLDINCTNANKSLIQLSTEPDDAIKDLVGTKGAYFIEDPISLRSCRITDLATSLITSNKKYYVVRNFLVDDCVVKLNKTTNGDAIINFNSAGYATNYVISNSTIWESGTKNDYFFSQYGGRPKDISPEGKEKQIMSIKNCTLYNVSKNKKFSNQSQKGQNFNEYYVTNSIIVDCGTNKFIPGLVEQQSKNPTCEYFNNTYFYNGVEVSANNTGDGCDNSGTAIVDDPAFKDPANGIFTVGGAGQISKRTGDPRWLPAE